ncbi:hypothetical protein [Acinetobacter pittii]|uniref:hypothetical protein n=2 Tax=Acinetobacter calcoaceticus/baumannii complex TaxID=909768 RepID=UPI0005EB0B65|nr:hypothetical protein [Acinetobacter pittii]
MKSIFNFINGITCLRSLINPFIYFTIFLFSTYYILTLPKFAYISDQSKIDIINTISIVLLPLTFILCCLSILTFSKNSSGNQNVDHINSAIFHARAFEPTNSTDLEISAVHEIGHVMLFFAVGTPLERLYVQIHDHHIGTSNNGYVHYRYEKKGEISLSAKEIQILMLMVLAGTQAERFYFNEPKMFGGSSDLDKWLHYAKAYLTHEEDVIFYQNPDNRFEHGHNQELLSNLKTKHISILNEFFNMNRDVLNEMIKYLLIKKRLDHSDLLPYFNKIKNIGEIEML